MFKKTWVWGMTLGLIIFTQTVHGQIKINEVLAANLTMNYDSNYNFESWVEIYNSGSSEINLKGYYLSDDKKNLKKWKVPIDTILSSQSHKLLWCNGQNKRLNTNFKLDPRGTGIYLSNPSAIIVDSITVPAQYPDVSYGRISNGNLWGYFLVPTPALINSNESVFGRLGVPIFSKPSGRYDSGITIELSSKIIGGQIRYTTDGAEPGVNSPLYAQPISIEKTTVVKAKVFLSGAIPSATEAMTYFINEHLFTIPVVSLSTNPSFFYGDTLGIYVEGKNGKTGNCSDVAKNWNQDWDRACMVQLFDKTGNELFSQGFNASITGVCTRRLPSKSIAFNAKWKFGKGSLDYQLFGSKSLRKFDSFRIRNSGNDFWSTMMRDGMIQSLLIGKMDIDYQAYEPAIAYLNGKYLGILNIREDIDANYIKNNYNISADSIDLLYSNAWVIEGSSSGYRTFLNNLSTMDVSKKEAFDYINANIDVDEYINYLIVEIYIGNYDWPGNNIKFWRHKRPGSKWRWIIFDTDYGFNLNSTLASTTYRSLHVLTDSLTTTLHPNPQWSTLLFRRVIKNPIFRERFIQSFTSALATTFKPAYVHQCIDSLANRIATEIVYHKQLYGGGGDWKKEVKKLHDFADQRYDFIVPYFQEFFSIYNKARINASVKSNVGGRIQVNKLNVSDKDTIRMYYKLPLEVSAEPSNGYRFKRWSVKSTAITRDYLITRNDTWKYYDKGGNPGDDWKTTAFDDSGWPSGVSELGYGDGDEKTILSYGTDSVNKYITTCFRKTLNISDTAKITGIDYNILFDDGAVVYVNGSEVGRFNMPAGPITSTTLALSNSSEGVFIKGTIDPKLLVPGNNLIAVEIHQYQASSPDLSFNMELEMTKYFGESTLYSINQVYKDTIKGDMYFVAEFEPKDPLSNIHINEISALDSKFVDEYKETEDWFELYNSSLDTIDMFGLYLTDNFKYPCKYRIQGYNKNSLKIPPQGYYVFWADDDCYQGINHCSFKLSASSERLGIFQIVGSDTLCLDSVVFGKQKALMSYSRFPDGDNQFIFTNVLTPLSSNKESIIIPLQITDNQNGTFSIYPNPVISYATIQSSEWLSNSTYRIYDMQGRKVDAGILDEMKTINCSGLTDGIYVLKMVAGDKEYTCKFVKHQ